MATPSPNLHLDALTPDIVWKHFRFLCDTPRPSGHEQAVQDGIVEWSELRGLSVERDAVGNVLVRKAATAGHEQAPGVVIQAHVDMVAQASVEHDFLRDPIHTEVREGWLHAQGTTLGADNGIGAAMALAILEDDTLRHGPLEALFTIGEEVSMVGAVGLQPEWLHGRFLINLDAEEWGNVYIGCAGGVHMGVDHHFPVEAVPAQEAVIEVNVGGLIGGHSGLDIGEQRASATALLARVLLSLTEQEPALRILSLEGGNMSNAINRSARAILAVPPSGVAALQQRITVNETTLKQELSQVEPELTCTSRPVEARHDGLSEAASLTLIRALAALPYGVERWSDEVPGVVETSNNIGQLRLSSGHLQLDAMVRSLCDSAALALGGRIGAVLSLAGLSPVADKAYPGWTPAAHSSLLTHFQRSHERVVGRPAEVCVIHAGLECGLIGAKYPDMDMIAFGPTIRGAHSPDERVELASVDACWQLLRDLVVSLGEASSTV